MSARADRNDREELIRRLTLEWARAALVLTAAIVYLLGFAPLYHSLGAGVAALALLPAAAAGFLLGLRGGLIVGLLSLLISAALLWTIGRSGEDIFRFEYGTGPIVVAMIGALSGWLRELFERIREHSRLLEREQAALHEEMAARARREEERLAFERKLMETQKLESLGLVAGGVAHDFNNLLTTVLGHAQLVTRELGPGSPAYESLQMIEVAAQRAADLTRQLRAYAGKTEFSIAPIDINTLIDEMTRLLKASIGKGVTLSTELATGLPTIEADATQIRQVVMNLIVNAAEASGAGGTIRVRTGLLSVDRSCLADAIKADDASEGDYVFVEVADDGCGMDAATMRRVFDPFFTTKSEGRGLGLAAVQGIVRHHHGALNVASEPGRGATFTVLLPCESSMVFQKLQSFAQ